MVHRILGTYGVTILLLGGFEYFYGCLDVSNRDSGSVALIHFVYHRTQTYIHI